MVSAKMLFSKIKGILEKKVIMIMIMIMIMIIIYSYEQFSHNRHYKYKYIRHSDDLTH